MTTNYSGTVTVPDWPDPNSNWVIIAVPMLPFPTFTANPDVTELTSPLGPNGGTNGSPGLKEPGVLVVPNGLTFAAGTLQVMSPTTWQGAYPPPPAQSGGSSSGIGDFLADAFVSVADTATFGLSTKILTSQTFGTVLDTTDQFFAGVASGVTGGLSDKLRAEMYGEVATRNHKGPVYQVGNAVGTGIAVVTSVANPCAMASLPALGLKGLNAAQAVNGVMNASDNIAKGNYGSAALDILGVAGNVSVLGKSCFVAGTPILTPEGSKPIEELKPGDRVLSKGQFDPDGEVRAKPVLQTFMRTAAVLNLHVEGRIIATTGEHPFYVKGKDWVEAHLLEKGDEAPNARWSLGSSRGDSP